MMNEALRTSIEQKLVDAGNPFAAFDFDGTCITNDVAEATLAHLCRNRLLKNATLLGGDVGNPETYHKRVFKRYYELLETNMIAAYLFAARMFAGFTLGEAEEIVSVAIDAEGEVLGKAELYGVPISHGLVARPALQELTRFLKEQGVDVWVVSASPEVAVRVAMRRFGYEGYKVIGLRNRIVGGVLTDLLEEPYSVREGKLDCIKAFINPKKHPMLAAGDSMNDAPMLEYAGIQVVIDRGNALAALARERGWHIITP